MPRSGHVDAVFAISPGRSGSAYLAWLMEQLPGCVSFHERTPVGNAQAMRRFLVGRPGLMQRIAQRKARHIAEARSVGKVYIETNHCFIKGFGWLLPQLLPRYRFGIVVLKRPARRIADSYQRLGATPLSPTGPYWVLTPRLVDPIIPPPHANDVRTRYELARCLNHRWVQPWISRLVSDFQITAQAYDHALLRWGVLETRALARAYRQRFPDYRYMNLTLKQLNQPQGVRSMLDAFGLPWTDRLYKRIGVAQNRKSERVRSVATMSRRVDSTDNAASSPFQNSTTDPMPTP